MTPAIQSRESIDRMSPNRKAIDDIEMGGKSAWSSMVGGDVFQDLHSRNSSNGTGSKAIKQGYEEAFAEAVGKTLPPETRDIRSGVSARRSSWGRSRDYSPELLGLSSSDGVEGNRDEDIVRSVGTGTNR